MEENKNIKKEIENIRYSYNIIKKKSNSNPEDFNEELRKENEKLKKQQIEFQNQFENYNSLKKKYEDLKNDYNILEKKHFKKKSIEDENKIIKQIYVQEGNSSKNNSLQSSKFKSPQIFEPFRNHNSQELGKLDKDILISKPEMNVQKNFGNNSDLDNDLKYTTLSRYLINKNTSNSKAKNNKDTNRINSIEKFDESLSSFFFLNLF